MADCHFLKVVGDLISYNNAVSFCKQFIELSQFDDDSGTTDHELQLCDTDNSSEDQEEAEVEGMDQNNGMLSSDQILNFLSVEYQRHVGKSGYESLCFFVPRITLFVRPYMT